MAEVADFENKKYISYNEGEYPSRLNRVGAMALPRYPELPRIPEPSRTGAARLPRSYTFLGAAKR
ncbi:hypothetical protein M413DRAFT_437771, partial [Hebeloma cylindrosporum]